MSNRLFSFLLTFEVVKGMKEACSFYDRCPYIHLSKVLNTGGVLIAYAEVLARLSKISGMLSSVSRIIVAAIPAFSSILSLFVS